MFRIEVALPVPLAKNFAYLCKSLPNPGVRVKVPFGRRKLIGVVLGEASATELEGIELKEIESILEDESLLSPPLIKLAHWMSQYYMYPLGSIFKMMLPAAKTSKPSSAEDSSSRLDSPAQEFSVPSLNENQELVVKEILNVICGPKLGLKPFLLHGVTGSGKTRVYLSLIQRLFIQFGSRAQAMVMVPEIALTPQMTTVFEECFPEQIAVVHSALSENQRWLQLRKIREGKAKILIGPRSAVYADFQELKLIIVDEEHDQSYKQASRLTYHARDVAVVRAHIEGIACLLGSATPMLESYWNATQGKYHLVKLQERAINTALPNVTLVPAPKSSFKEKVKSDSQDISEESFLSPETIEALRENLSKGQQAMVLVNRRGYAYYLFNCETQQAIECPDCSISLTVHKNKTKLLCHYCGFQSSIHEVMSLYPQTTFSTVGVGCEKAEAILKKLIPEARIARLDSDILTTRDKLFSILTAFRNGEIDILTGTQIIAKGHDFPNVALTVICELDRMLDLPDFRSGERSFQLLVQAAGRSGRADKQGQVLLQTQRAFHPIIQNALLHDYASFMKQELELRKAYGYPPFAHLIRVELSCLDSHKLTELCAEISQWQQKYFAKRPKNLLREIKIIGPVIPPIEKINRRFRRAILVSGTNLRTIHGICSDLLRSFPMRKGDIRVQVDVDPQSLL